MSDPTPRKRRPQSPPPARGGSPLPWVALVIGVIVAGLGIGALISAYQNRGGPPPELGAGVPQVTPVPTVTPDPDQSPLSTAPSPTPTPAVTLAPTAAPTATAVPTTAPTATPSPTPSPSASAAPSAAATASPAASPTPTATPTPTPKPTPTATPKPTAPPTAKPSPTPAPTTAPNAAVGIVRRYLDAVIAGDTAGASALLAPGGTVKEAAVIDGSAHVTAVHQTHADATGTSVEAEFATARGSYVGTFHVTSGGTIDQHDYIKV
jgi:hypothetical protein